MIVEYVEKDKLYELRHGANHRMPLIRSPHRELVVHYAVMIGLNICPDCEGVGFTERLGDGPGFEVDVISTETCSRCEGTGEYA